MPATKISDVIVPDVFNPYLVERSTELVNFYMGGILSNDPQLNALATQGGATINMPFWTDLTGDDEVLSDSVALTPQNINSNKDIAALFMRGKAWGVNDLAKALSGDDPMRHIADLVAEFRARKKQQLIISLLSGVMADNVANSSSDMSVDLSGATNAAVNAGTKFSYDAFVDAQQTFGDASGGLSGIAMHSTVYHNMKRLDPTSFERESQGAAEIETYRGLRLIVNDSMPYTPAVGPNTGDAAAKYTSYVFGQGAIALGNGAAPVPVETDRDTLLGEDYLMVREHFVLHLRGVKFNNATVAGASPSNAEAALSANWSRVYDRKNVRVAQVITNG